MYISLIWMFHSELTSLDTYDSSSSPNLIWAGDFESMQHDALDNIQITDCVSELDIKESSVSSEE